MKKHAAKLMIASMSIFSQAAFSANLGDVLENISGVNHLLSPEVTSCSVDGFFKRSQISRCSNPYEAVCANSSHKSAHLDDLKGKIRKKSLKNAGFSGQSDPTQDALARIEELQKQRVAVSGKPEESDVLKKLIEAEKSVMTMMADSEKQIEGKLQVSPESFRGEVEKIKDQLKTQIAADDDVTRKTAMMDKVSAIKLQTPSAMAETDPTTDAERDRYDQEFQTVLDLCDSDGMVDNAMYMGQRNEMLVCPGSLMPGLVSGRGLDALIWTLGHEMGHSIDPKKVTIPKAEGYYAEFFACMNKNYAADFPPPSQVLAQLKLVGIPKLQKLLEKVEAETPNKVAYIANLKRKIRLGGESVDDISLMQDALGNPTYSYRAELAGDFYGNSRLAQALATLPVKDRWSEVVASLDDFCPGTPSFEMLDQLEWANFPDAEHPADHFRIEQAMHNPAIRELLGCPKLTKLDQPWCGLKGEER